MVKKDTVLVTPEGNIPLKAGDIITKEIVQHDEIEELKLYKGGKPKDADNVWDAGWPFVLNDNKSMFSRLRDRRTYGDMDSVLPPEILARRKRLVLDRMKQERNA